MGKNKDAYVEDTFRLVSKSASHLTKQAVKYTAAHDLVFRMAIDEVSRLASDLHARVTALEQQPTAKYCGVWKADREYVVGNLVTSSGSLWWCDWPNTDIRPGSPMPPGREKCWTLVAKRGGA